MNKEVYAQVAASFVRSAAGVEQIRTYLTECHARYATAETPIPLIISKIESTEARMNDFMMNDEIPGRVPRAIRDG